MRIKNKKIFLILSFSCILILFLISFSFAKELEIKYPDVDGAPTTTKTLLPDYIRYVFNLSLMIAGLVAFASLVYGGFSYMTSADNPSKMDDAKEQIMASVLGLIILLSSYLILTTINPQLVILKMPGVPIDKGVILYTKNIDVCNQEKADPMDKRGEDFEKFPKSSRTLNNLNDKVQSIYFYQGGNELKVTLYSEEDYKNPVNVFENQTEKSCQLISSNVKSIKLEWTIPGVHLYSEENYEKDETVYYSKLNALPDFNDKTKSIKFMATDLRAILHEDKNREGECSIYLDDSPDLNNFINNHKIKGASSITVFNYNKEETSRCDVTLYTEKNYEGDLIMYMFYVEGTVIFHERNYEATKQYTSYRNKEYGFVLPDKYNDKIESINIEGNCIAVLFDHKDGRLNKNYTGKCEVYEESDSDMSNNYSNTCWGKPCTSSLMILPTKPAKSTK